MHAQHLVALTIAIGLVTTLTAGDVKPAVNVGRGSVALRGYDAVAYLTSGKPLRGSPEFELRWNGVMWRFASAVHRDTFGQDPHKYAPQFGGYCAWAVAHGYTADGDPQAWRLIDGKLYLNYSKSVQRMWERDIPKFIAAARANWPRVLGAPSK